MKLTIRPASAETFDDLGSWRYEPPYDFYDGDVDPVLNPRAQRRPFSERAITVYERAGFGETGRHVRHFDRWADVEFVEMELLEPDR